MAKTKHYPLRGFDERLRELWLMSGLTQKQIAQCIGYERKTVRAWIYGDCTPNALALARLCSVFNVSADYLLFGKEKENGKAISSSRIDRNNI